MKKNLYVVAVLGFLGWAGLANAQAIKEGEWLMTVTIKNDGMQAEMAEAMAGMSEEEKAMMAQMMGGMNMGAEGISHTTKQCISQDDPVPQAEDDEGCTSTHQTNGNTVIFETTCPDGSSTGSVTYEGDAMQGTIASVADGETVTIEISGEYVGPCTQ